MRARRQLGREEAAQPQGIDPRRFPGEDPAPAEDPALARATRDELEAMLEHALGNEDYELAARIRDELTQRG